MSGEDASAAGGGKSERNEAPRSADVPRSKRAQRRAPQEGCEATSSPSAPAKNKQVERLAYFLSIAKAMVYHQHALRIVSHQSVRTVYHHGSAVYRNAFTMMIYNSSRIIVENHIARI